MKTMVLAALLTHGAPLDEAATAGRALIEYCRACHAVGPLRFIRSSDPAEVWQSIHDETVPGSEVPWSEAIRAALSWPTEAPPRAGSQREPGKEWMPKGAKREQVAADRIGGESVRAFLLRMLGQE